MDIGKEAPSIKISFTAEDLDLSKITQSADKAVSAMNKSLHKQDVQTQKQQRKEDKRVAKHKKENLNQDKSSNKEAKKSLSLTQKITKTLGKSVALFSAAGIGGALGLKGLTANTRQYVDNLNRINSEFDLPISKIQELESVAKNFKGFNLNAKQVVDDIAGFQKTIDAVKSGYADGTQFNLLGIDLSNQDAFGVLEDIREAFRTTITDKSQQRALLNQLGLSDDYLAILRLTSEEYEQYGKQSLKLNLKNIDKVRLLNNEWKFLTNTVSELKDQAISEFAPSVTKNLEAVNSWVKNNSGSILKFFSTMAKSLQTIAEISFSGLKIALDSVVTPILNLLNIDKDPAEVLTQVAVGLVAIKLALAGLKAVGLSPVLLAIVASLTAAVKLLGYIKEKRSVGKHAESGKIVNEGLLAKMSNTVLNAKIFNGANKIPKGQNIIINNINAEQNNNIENNSGDPLSNVDMGFFTDGIENALSAYSNDLASNPS